VFIESFATVCVEGGMWFLTREAWGFSAVANLWLALIFGTCYVIGSQMSHRLACRMGEKKLLVSTLAAQAIVHAAIGIWLGPVSIYIGVGLLGTVHGAKWPVIESYVSAGHTPAMTAKAVGRFNVAWSAALPLALIPAGSIIAVWAPGLLLLPAALNLISLVLVLPLESSPIHLPDDHPERLPAGRLRRYQALMGWARWQMLGCYAAMWVLMALLPHVFGRLGFTVRTATVLAAVLHVMRLVTFATLQRYSGWRNRALPLAIVIVTLPTSFFMALFGPNVAVVVCGEILFGWTAGMAYTAALYYGMVVGNASVGAGGKHEGLIGLGFTIGPAAGLIGSFVVGSAAGGMVLGIAPLFAVCAAGALQTARSLWPGRRS